MKSEDEIKAKLGEIDVMHGMLMRAQLNTQSYHQDLRKLEAQKDLLLWILLPSEVSEKGDV